jgi:hypothetical protein
MPAPDLYTKAGLDPLPEAPPSEAIPWEGVLYATDREPAGADDDLPYDLNDRGYLVRLGVARVDFLEGSMTWEEAKEISLRDDRRKGHPLTLVGADEIGVLDRSVSPTWPQEANAGPARKLAERIGHKLGMSTRRDVYIVENADARNGHAYFRQSPWASSDLLLTLLTDLDPEARGLERDATRSVWTFPADYPDRLVAAVTAAAKDPPPEARGGTK